LEETLKGKVTPLLEETMEESWGITIPQLESDITDKLKNPRLQIYVAPNLSFSKAKNKFKQEFLKKELRLHLGNITQLAKTLDLDRRSIHRAIKTLEIDIESVRDQELRTLKEEEVNETIRSSLRQYSEFIQPQQMEKMYARVPSLSRNIAKLLPHTDVIGKEAKREFEEQFLSRSLKENSGNITDTAKKLKIRVETLYRKLKALGL
jgi:DNA-binding NtrC family response regulator